MSGGRNFWFAFIAVVSGARLALATGIPIDGFLPQVGITLTREYSDELADFAPVPETEPGSLYLGYTSRHYAVALLDTGAAVSLLTSASDNDFNINGPYSGANTNFRGTESITIGGASGFLEATINDPMGLYAAGLQDRSTSSGALVVNHTPSMRGQTNTSLITVPAESDLPNVLGLPFMSQYATRIRNSQPQIFEVNGKTVRTPAIDFHELGTGGSLGISRKAQLNLLGAAPSTPAYFFNIANLDIDRPWNNPSQPTVVQGGHFMNATVQNNGASSTTSFFFDTGASVTVLSQFKALEMGFDVTLDTPEFTISIVGSGGVKSNVPGFFVDQLTIPALGGSVVAANVPVIVLDVTNVANPGNVVDGIIGTNIFQGRDIIIDPNPSLGGGGATAGVYISNPVTSNVNWSTTAASGAWTTGANWNPATTPGALGIANLRHVSGGNQTAVLSATTQVFEANISGAAGGSTMTLRIDSGAKLTTFSGLNIESRGVVSLVGGTIDAQYVEVLDSARLEGNGTIRTGSGEIAGQVENTKGTVAAGLGAGGTGTLTIAGRYSNGAAGTLAIDLAGTTAGTTYDQLAVDGNAGLGGTLSVSLANGFVPAVGNSFTLIDTTEGLGGAFTAYNLPSLAAGSWFDTSTDDNFVLRVVGAGDFNNDLKVDASDYTTWRDGRESNFYTAADYNVWRNNFGQVYSAVAAVSAVPEPASSVLVIGAVAMMVKRRK
jgi:hypothetical protein